MLKIAIVTGSTRPGPNNGAVAIGRARKRKRAQVSSARVYRYVSIKILNC
jgi:hypothetical protein